MDDEQYRKYYDQIHLLRYEHFEFVVQFGSANQILQFIKDFGCRIEYDDYFIDLVARNDLNLVKEVMLEYKMCKLIVYRAYMKFLMYKDQFNDMLNFLDEYINFHHHRHLELSTHQNS